MEGCTMEVVTPGKGHLDTVRALHQTVVSLRTALELSKNELKELKQKYEQHAICLDYADVIEKLTLENHVLRRKIIDSDTDERDISQKLKLQFTYSPRNNSDNEIIIKAGTDVESAQNKSDLENLQEENLVGEEKILEVEELSENESSDINDSGDNGSSVNEQQEESKSELTLSKVKADNTPSLKTKLELLSKFDVRIKVRTIKEGTVVSSTTSDTDSTGGDNKDKFNEKDTDCRIIHLEETQEHFTNTDDKQGKKVNLKTISTENIKMAVPNEEEVKANVDKFNVQVRITSEENLVVEESIQQHKRKDTLNLDVDDLSLRSMSEGDNSVFSEGGTSPAEPPAPGAPDDVSGNESEEVDDIELIFTTDEARDISNLQEDLVSIQDSDIWVPTSGSTHSTPVLVKFHTLDPDFQPGSDPKEQVELFREKSSTPKPTESALKIKRVSLPNDREFRHVAFTNKCSLDLPGRGILKSVDNKSDISLFRRSPNISSRKLDSIDSLSCDYTQGLSLDTKSSSYDLGSSMDILTRGDSVDSFHKTPHLGHRFSLFAETDISKCGISEEDLAHNMYLRRNTSPNPFQYNRAAGRVGRTGGPLRPPLLVGGAGRPRLVLRGAPGARTENAAQTDLSALPPRWTSDQYLAYKLPSTPLSAPTVPQRVAPPARKLLMPQAKPYDARPALSDIGFTSMVPELSRSADPLWAMTRRVNASPTNSTSSTAKYLSRGSFRSPCLSVDRSNEWIPPVHVPRPYKSGFRSWRTSLPDVRQDDTDDLLQEAETYLRRSTDNLQSNTYEDYRPEQLGAPYIPGEPRHLRLGHTVKVITPQGRVAVGRVRYVGLAGSTSTSSSVVVGAEFPHSQYPGLPRNDGSHNGRRYFLTPPHSTALFVPFNKVVMAWAN